MEQESIDDFLKRMLEKVEAERAKLPPLHPFKEELRYAAKWINILYGEYKNGKHDTDGHSENRTTKYA